MRVQAALTALLFVLSSLVGIVHEATTRHVQCAEHGEQIHSDALPVAAVADRAPAPSTASFRPQPIAAIHGHEHCLMASATRESRLAPEAPALATSSVATAEVVAVAPPVAIRGAHRVYRTAPKTSPPA